MARYGRNRRTELRGGGMTDGGEQCKHCGIDLTSFTEAVEHHDEEHPNRTFDPLWYTYEGRHGHKPRRGII